MLNDCTKEMIPIGERKVYLKKVSLDKARGNFFSRFREYTAPTEKIPTSKALGRVTAEPATARRSAPHFYASAMDGIAVRAEDTAGAREGRPVKLAEEVQAVKVDTGDPVPDGLNAVIKIEEVNQEESGIFAVERSVPPWHHIRTIGESVIKGQMIATTNQRITPGLIGALLEAGISEIAVRKRPQVGIIPTGSELVDPGKEPRQGQLVDFNSAMVAAATEMWGGVAKRSNIIEDEYGQIREVVSDFISENELTVIIAGSSAGEEDHTARVLAELGEIIVHGVNIMPGKPVVLAEVEGKPVIGLPGYPLSCLLAYNLFARPLIYRLQGQKAPPQTTLRARVKRKVPSKVGLKEFVRVNLIELEGEVIAVPGKRGASSMDSLLKADGLMPVDENEEGLAPGTVKEVYCLRDPKSIPNNLLFLGSHDLGLDLVREEINKKSFGFDLRLQSVGSMAGLMALKRKECHLAGIHLFDASRQEYNLPYIERTLGERSVLVINLVHREQGLMVKPDNPLDIAGLKDLTREEITFINRQRGAGTRILLDHLLDTEEISASEITGYSRQEFTHTAAAAAVAYGRADAALGIRAAAAAHSLDFIPITDEQYDLVIPQKLAADWRVEKLIKLLREPEFKARIASLEGYSTERTGESTEISGKD